MKKLLFLTITTIFIAGSMSACAPARHGIGVGYYGYPYSSYYSYWGDGDYFGGRRYRDRHYYRNVRTINQHPPRIEGMGHPDQQSHLPAVQRKIREQPQPRIQHSRPQIEAPRIQRNRPGGGSPSIRRSGEMNDSTRQKTVAVQET